MWVHVQQMIGEKEEGTYGGETGDINAGQVCRYTVCGLIGLAEPIKARVGDGDTRFLRGNVSL